MTSTTPPFAFTVCGRNAVRATARRFGATHVVSLHDPDQVAYRPSRVDGVNHLRLAVCDDTDPSLAHAPTRWTAQAVLHFGQRLGPDARVLVHCEAGVSRSTAAAVLLLAQATGDAALAVALVVAARPQARPNPLLVAHGADLLGLPQLAPLAAAAAAGAVARRLAGLF